MSGKAARLQFPYTKRNLAIKELARRRADAEIQEKLRALFAQYGLEPFDIPGTAILCRQIATPNHETIRFLQLTTGFDLKPTILEFPADKFASSNVYKRSLAKLPIYVGKNKNGESMYRNESLVDMNGSNGLPLKEVTAKTGERLPDLHRRLLSQLPDFAEATVVDNSENMRVAREKMPHFYDAIFAIATANAILFEDFTELDPGHRFMDEVILPAFQRVSEHFGGLAPLIVPLEPPDSEEDLFWLSYPAHLKLEP